MLDLCLLRFFQMVRLTLGHRVAGFANIFQH